MIPWTVWAAATVAAVAWILAWCRRGVEEIGRDMRRILIAEARAEEER